MTLHHLLVAARVAVDAGERSMARELLGEASKRMDRFSDGMGPMRARLAAIRARMRARSKTAPQAEPLTRRERDVLQLLQRSLSTADMA